MVCTVTRVPGSSGERRVVTLYRILKELVGELLKGDFNYFWREQMKGFNLLGAMSRSQDVSPTNNRSTADVRIKRLDRHLVREILNLRIFTTNDFSVVIGNTLH